jgi:tetratricopeptide (TPR) repeat protein
MSPERWNRLQALFDAAVDLSAAEAEGFLRAECADDLELYSEVWRMLDEHRRAGFLDRSPAVAQLFDSGAVIAGRYRILRPLGRGGMGQVYEAEDIELHERVALKSLLPEIAGDTRMIVRFKREIQLSRKIGHPNVCRVFDLARHPPDGSSPDTVFLLTMEFLDGETLGARIAREGRLPAAEALALLAQMADALDAAHRAGILHRDFKPSNVMLIGAGGAPGGSAGQSARAVVTDFGLACRIAPSPESTDTATGQIAGTIDYMAPELLTGSEASVASDIYALGLVAYKTITGGLPFESTSPLAGVIRRAGQRTPSVCARVAGLDPAWDRALARALDPDPARRFNTAREFVDTLRGESASVTFKLPVITRRGVAGAALGAAFMVAAPFAWHAWMRARSRPSPEAEALYRQGAADLHAGAHFAATKALEQAARLAPGFALAHARLAEAWSNLDLTDKATQEMLLARRQDLSTLSRLDRLQLEAIDLALTREFPAAAAKYEQMLSLGSPDSDGIYLDLGRAYDNAGKPDKATEAYRRAAEGPAHNPAAWLSLGVLYSRAGTASKADQAFQQAEQLYRLGNNLEGSIELAFQRGSAASARDQFETATAYLNSALETARLAGNVQQEVRIKLYLSTNAYRSGDAASAERYAREALDTARLNRIDSLAVRGLVSLGSAYSRKGDSGGAERYYQQALNLARSGSSPRLTALSLLSLAAVHDAAAQFKTSEPEAAEALAFYQANGFARESFQCLTILGRARVWAEDYESAMDFFGRASAVAEGTQDRSLMALGEESLGTVLLAQERYPEALPHFQRDLDLSATDERRGYAGLNCAEMLWFLGRYDEAREAIAAAEARAVKFPALRLRLLRDRAGVELSQEHYTEASTLASQALAANNGRDGTLHSQLAGLLGLAQAGSGNLARGLQLCRESLDAAEKVGATTTLNRARLTLALALAHAGDRSGVLAALRDHDPDATKYPESRWRALALMSQADPRYTAPAREAASGLERLWGQQAFQKYLARPDVRRLWRPLFRPVTAIHQ